MPAPMVSKKPTLDSIPNPAGDRLPMNAMEGEVANVSAPPEMMEGIKEKLVEKRKSLPGVGFKVYSGDEKAKKAVKSIKRAKKKLSK